MTEFSQLNLHPQVVKAVTDQGYTTPTDIQNDIIPIMLDGKDVTAQSQTGSGKTAAFALPILSNMVAGGDQVQCLTIAPTRELAMQVAKSFEAYGKDVGVRVLAVYGGAAYGPQLSKLRRGVDVVVGTPGRLLDLIRKKHLDLSGVFTVVLDEADEMLSMGFIEDIESILKATPKVRQTALFSATLPTQIRRLADKYMKDPVSITVARKQMTVSTIKQSYYLVNKERDKLAAITRLFEMEDISSALVFARTRISTGELAHELSRRGFTAEALNGDLSQDARIRVLNRFREHKIKVLVATDVAARGLDIDDISHVFNYDLPQDPEVYVHRVGRTGRAGKDGVAITLLTPKDKGRIHRIERYTKQQMTQATLPTVAEIWAGREERLMNKVRVWLERDRSKREFDLVSELAAEGIDPLKIAAVCLKIMRSEENKRPIAEIGAVVEKASRKGRKDRYTKREGGRNDRSRGRKDGRRSENGNRSENGSRRDNGPAVQGKTSHESGMVRLSLGKGKADGIRPNDIVGTIAYHANIPGYSIGKILIKQEHTFVDVPEQYISQVMAQKENFEIHKEKVSVKVAE
ncbi:MAG: DEAD/DEAH box helicase [Chloroflexi bacterium]|nr:DEAD/DEAH box helicase [Chloroflexota bacterium]MBT3668711.1 DEAD/DEAH box helicase [Chloroflexota bacterium]MBT4305412.1 DEAD/DEAH box helicase [Chloroflexota bacterium]MBT4533023.1 DEAD/DEAH box helicase [Chloroflexota bacterium]MBT4683219.1 DEAD/DEAH box helicase [Chloroflexota bacterium]